MQTFFAFLYLIDVNFVFPILAVMIYVWSMSIICDQIATLNREREMLKPLKFEFVETERWHTTACPA